MEGDDSGGQSVDLVFIKTDSTLVPAVADNYLESDVVVKDSRQEKESKEQAEEEKQG